MSDVVISVENLSKRYLVGHNTAQTEQPVDFRELISRNVSNLARKTRDMLSGRPLVQGDAVEEFWALNDVSFEVRRGDRLGIIGRNGAGKSTLLKILSRITEPTKGRVRITGRVASLLEVGTGFHPELSGRENIYLNGAMLGMSRAEVHRKFDEIVAFADVERFLDTPVKRYSSGMYVRLAFAVAAHLEPEILIVDEVLAVGDAQFQKKCLGKMEALEKDGRTILFVSHNMGAISQLCSTCIWLDKGEIGNTGSTSSVVNEYMLNGSLELSNIVTFADDMSKDAQLKSISLFDKDGNTANRFDCDSPINIKFDLDVKRKVPGLYGHIEIGKTDGVTVLVSDSFDAATFNPLDELPTGITTFAITIPARTLGHGDYYVHYSMVSSSANIFTIDAPGIVCGFSLEDLTSMRGNRRLGFFSTLLEWRRLVN
jgi:lipopolysaccharide transport system ATP-binding protein